MTQFRVWAPNAQTLDIVVNGSQQAPMQPELGGWWQIDLPEAGAETDYAFRLDGGSPLPDPRSPWQPRGVHGPSRTIDHSRFEWHDHHWRQSPLSAALFYELHIGTFNDPGTFDSAIERLDYLADLGVTHIEVMPVAEFPGERGWGYDGVDLWAPYHIYGGPDGFKRLVDACHQKGIAVVLDVVYNHLGPDGNYLSQFGPYFSDRHHTPWGPSMNLDGPHSDEVRAFFIDNACMWLRDYHIDGLRLDAVHTLFDNSAVHFLEELTSKVKRLEAQVGRPLYLIAESDLNDPRLIRSPLVGGYGMDAQWDDSFHHALYSFLSGERDGYMMDYGNLEYVAKALQKGYVYDGQYSTFRQRHHGRPAVGVLSYCFLAYIQNHDQCGNRGLGERSCHILNPGQLKCAAALLFTAPFTPMLFMGEEWAASTPFQYFTDHHDPLLSQAVSEGRKKDFGAFGWDPEVIPDPQHIDAFNISRLNWAEQAQPDHAEILDWHRQLIALRRSSPDLLSDWATPLEVRFDEEKGWLLVRRGRVTLIGNLGAAAQYLACPPEWMGQLRLISDPAAHPEGEGWQMPPHSTVILMD